MVRRARCTYAVCGYRLPPNPSFGFQFSAFVSSGVEKVKRTASFAHDGTVSFGLVSTTLAADALAVAVQYHLVTIGKDRDGRGRGGMVGRRVGRGNMHHRTAVEAGLRDAAGAHALHHVVARFGVAVDIGDTAKHGFVFCPTVVVVVAPQKVASHARIGIEHAPIEVSVAA